MPTVYPLITEKQTFWINGAVASGAKMFVYLAGTTTKATVYTETEGVATSANPVVLNSRGEAPYGVYVVGGSQYKLVLAPSTDSDPPAAAIWTRDELTPYNDTNITISQWQTGPTPTYVSGTSFTLVGDQTADFQAGRRVLTTNTGGSIYGTIVTSAYTSLTTVTVVNDSGSLDAGLSAVSLGLLTPTNPAVPLLADTYPIASGSSDKTKKFRVELDGLTTATTRVMTVPNYDFTAASLAGTESFTNKTLVSPVLSTGVSGDAFATQAQQVTGTSTTHAVLTGRQQFHPSAAKGWVYFTVSGGTLTQQAGYNATATRNNTGDFTVTWGTDFSSANYAWLVTHNADRCTIGVSPTVAAGSVRFKTVRTTDSSDQDPTVCSVLAFGEQV